MGLEERFVDAFGQIAAKKNAYDLLIVGNGFDLGCKYKTGYDDFLSSCEDCDNFLFTFFKNAYRKRFIINNEWNGFENLLCQYLQFLDYLFYDKDNVEWWFSREEHHEDGTTKYPWFNLKIKDLAKIPNNVYLILRLFNPLTEKLHIYVDENFRVCFDRFDTKKEPKELFFRVYADCEQVDRTKEYVLDLLLEELDKELADLEKRLKEYIRVATSSSTQGPLCLRGCSAKRLISFNYSTTAQKVFKIEDRYSAYIHGSVMTDVVLGIEPSMIAGQSFGEESSFIRFFKRFRRIYKNCNNDYHNKIVGNMVSKSSSVAIYGHSLDLSDRSILAPIFEKEEWTYDVFCFLDEGIYKLKLAKLIGLDLLEKLEHANRIHFIKIVE